MVVILEMGDYCTAVVEPDFTMVVHLLDHGNHARGSTLQGFYSCNIWRILKRAKPQDASVESITLP